jgi:poly(A) polymerase Pap1
MCSFFQSALRAQEELIQGEKVCTGIVAGSGRPTDWHRLFEPDSFFQRFKNYLQARQPHAFSKSLT